MEGMASATEQLPLPHSNYKPGDVIVDHVQPLLYCLSPKSSDGYCSGCFCPTRTVDGPPKPSRDLKTSPLITVPNPTVKPLKPCEVCDYFYFCSPDCQATDWANFHGHGECEIYETHGKNDLFKLLITRITLRCIILLTKRPHVLIEKHQILGGSELSFMDLVDRKELIELDTERISLVDKVISFFTQIGLEFDVEQLKLILFKTIVNTIAIDDLKNNIKNIGIALFVQSTPFRHSCAPNSAAVLSELKLQIRAMKDITSEDEITFAYFDILKSKKRRQFALRTHYYFNCNCTRCVQEDKEDEKLCRQADFLEFMIRHFDVFDRSPDRWKHYTGSYELYIEMIEKICGKYYPFTIYHKFIYYMNTLLSVEDDLTPIFTANEILGDMQLILGDEHPLSIYCSLATKKIMNKNGFIAYQISFGESGLAEALMEYAIDKVRDRPELIEILRPKFEEIIQEVMDPAFSDDLDLD